MDIVGATGAALRMAFVKDWKIFWLDPDSRNIMIHDTARFTSTLHP
jgi:hypothetical protein